MAGRGHRVGSVARMRPAQLRPAAVLSALTVLVWTTRIRNIWTDESLTVAGQVGRTTLALVFTAFAVATGWVWWQARRGRPVAGSATLVRAFAVWTVLVWVVRGVQIALADHDAAFVAVHTLLALVSIGLAIWADRSARRAPDREPALSR